MLLSQLPGNGQRKNNAPEFYCSIAKIDDSDITVIATIISHDSLLLDRFIGICGDCGDGSCTLRYDLFRYNTNRLEFEKERYCNADVDPIYSFDPYQLLNRGSIHSDTLWIPRHKMTRGLYKAIFFFYYDRKYRHDGQIRYKREALQRELYFSVE